MENTALLRSIQRSLSISPKFVILLFYCDNLRTFLKCVFHTFKPQLQQHIFFAAMLTGTLSSEDGIS